MQLFSLVLFFFKEMEKIDTRTCIRRQDESISIKSVCKEENASRLLLRKGKWKQKEKI